MRFFPFRYVLLRSRQKNVKRIIVSVNRLFQNKCLPRGLPFIIRAKAWFEVEIRKFLQFSYVQPGHKDKLQKPGLFIYGSAALLLDIGSLFSFLIFLHSR
jgi:hypothetical protein